jgi:ABC-type multidrug transport system fused ATPase/permease subunit
MAFVAVSVFFIALLGGIGLALIAFIVQRLTQATVIALSIRAKDSLKSMIFLLTIHLDASLRLLESMQWALKMLTILDEYTRECHVLWAERALKAADVLHWLQKAVEQHGAPKYLRSDNGSEFIAKIVQRWLKENRIKTIYIEPGSPWQNGFVESFHGRFRDECLNREHCGR